MIISNCVLNLVGTPLLALHLVPVAIAFFGAAVLLLALRAMTMREAYGTIEWSVLILLGALIPVSEAIRTTGGTDLIAGWLSGAVEALPPTAAVALMLEGRKMMSAAGCTTPTSGTLTAAPPRGPWRCWCVRWCPRLR